MSATLNGRNLNTVVVNTADYTITRAMNKSIFTNEGDAGVQVLALPAAVVGMEYEFHLLAAQEMRIDPNGSETIALPSSGAQGAAGKYLSADAVGEWVKLKCLKAGQWQVVGYAGTWTAEG